MCILIVQRILYWFVDKWTHMYLDLKVHIYANDIYDMSGKLVAVKHGILCYSFYVSYSVTLWWFGKKTYTVI